jgi:hypothetical protein
MIGSIRGTGAEPLLQMPSEYSENEATALVNILNVSAGVKIISNCRQTSPWSPRLSKVRFAPPSNNKPKNVTSFCERKKNSSK